MIAVLYQITDNMKIAITADFVPSETAQEFLQRIANENKFHYVGQKSLIERMTGRTLAGSEIMMDQSDYQLVGFLEFERG